MTTSDENRGLARRGPVFGATEDVAPLAFDLPFLEHTEATIEANLALDEALLVAAETRGAGPALRVWEPSRLAVVLGASCRIRDDVDVAACRRDGVEIARRSSGGGTVLVGPGTLNVSIVLAADAAPGLNAVDTAQAYVLGRTARALRRLGRPVEVRGHGDLTLGDRKFAGSAQRRLRTHFLVHLSLLYDFSVEAIARYLRDPPRQPAYRGARTHDRFLTNLSLPRAEILMALRAEWGAFRPGFPPCFVPEDLVQQLVYEKFADPAWVERL